jgi:hypothetical protein
VPKGEIAMGYIRHHSILVSTYDKDSARFIHSEAVRIFGYENVQGPSETSVNLYYIIHVIPDGSKEGWEASKDGDDGRESFISILENLPSPHYCQYVEVQWCDDEGIDEVVASSTDKYNEE